MRSPRCPLDERWHAQSTLLLLAQFVALTTTSARPDALAWDELDPDQLVHTALDIDEDCRFVKVLLDLSSAFYGFLGEEGHIETARARRIRTRLVTLALGLRA